ncbi:MAG: long-chain acyl-CoA synthetase [Myxococcota bacterium]|jgi:long-chain acyl-CoA synthetase
MPYDSIALRLLKQGQSRPSTPAYYVKSGGSWVSTDYATYARQTRQAARALVSLGLEPGGSVAILGFNKPEWCMVDVACMMAGGAPAGIYTTCSPGEVQYIIDHSESGLVLVENHDQWAKVKEERDKGNLPKLNHVVLMKGAAAVDDDMVMTWDEFMAKADDTEDSVIDERLDGIKKEECATYIYTSGTTGPPKAVMLSHENLSWTADLASEIVDLREGDKSVSYLPLSHIAEQMFTLHGPITQGTTVYFAESIEKVADNFKEVQPTVLFAVPRIWEKFYAGVNGKLAMATGIKAKLVAWARSVGTEVSDAHNSGTEVAGLLALKYTIANKVIFSKLKPAIGLGEARICVSGAAPISAEILRFFGSLDVRILEVYGQSEDSGPTSFNLPGATKFGSVGKAVKGVQVRIIDGEGKDAEEGEIIVKGPNVFLGYYKDEDATNDTLKDGWLYSGDIGKFDRDGYLSITGRIKEIIITAGGKNIAPKNIEAALKNHPLVSQAVVIGDRRKYLSALLTLDPDASAAWGKEKDISGDVHSSEQLIAEIQGWVDKTNAMFARVEHVRKFTVLAKDFEPGNELTPTLKVKRRIVNDLYSDQIEGMYT